MAKQIRWRSYSQPVWVGFFTGHNRFRRLSNYLPGPFSASATPEEMNARHLILEIIWFGLALGSTLTFQVVYATRFVHFGTKPFALIIKACYNFALIIEQIPHIVGSRRTSLHE